MLVSILTLVFLYSFRENRIPVALSHLQPLLYGAYVDGSHDGGQGGRTWQPFGGSKNGNENFRQGRTYNFCVKCVVCARNRKIAKLTQ